MKHVWVVQSKHIESTDEIWIFSSEKKAMLFLKTRDNEKNYYLIGKGIVH